jgi:hypothetical protein
MPVFALISPKLLSWARSSRAYSIVSAGWREGAADLAAVGLSDAAGVRGPLGGEGALHLGEQRQEQERDAAHALVRWC